MRWLPGKRETGESPVRSRHCIEGAGKGGRERPPLPESRASGGKVPLPAKISKPGNLPFSKVQESDSGSRGLDRTDVLQGFFSCALAGWFVSSAF